MRLVQFSKAGTNVTPLELCVHALACGVGVRTGGLHALEHANLEWDFHRDALDAQARKRAAPSMHEVSGARAARKKENGASANAEDSRRLPRAALVQN